jgi:nuclear pore complex protein Nup155
MSLAQGQVSSTSTGHNITPVATQNGQLTAEKSTPVDIPALQSASRLLNEQFTKDAQIVPDLGDSLATREPSFDSLKGF